MLSKKKYHMKCQKINVKLWKTNVKINEAIVLFSYKNYKRKIMRKQNWKIPANANENAITVAVK